MPADFHGFGTMYHGYAAAVKWHQDASFTTHANHDVVECYVAAYLPIFPRAAFHTYDWSGDICRTLPIRPPGRLLLRAFLRGPLTVVLAIGAIASIVGGLTVGGGWYNSGHLPDLPWIGLPHLLGFAAIEVAAVFLAWRLASLDARDRDIRLVIGPHEYGSSDPATWTEETLGSLRPNTELLGSEDEVEAAHAAILAADFGRAMFAARLAVARRGEVGELVTEEVLAEPALRALLPELRRRPWKRADLLPASSRPSAVPIPFEGGRAATCHRDGAEMGPECGAIFYDGRAYCDACLNAAGGEGFADAVRREPVIDRVVPNGPLMSLLQVCLAMAGIWFALSSWLHPSRDGRPSTAFPGLLVAVVFGYHAIQGRRRRARIGGARLLVGGSGALMVDTIAEVRPTHWLIHSPIYRATAGDGDAVQWPRTGPGGEAIARALTSAIALRRPP